jgi:hypothetical protein
MGRAALFGVARVLDVLPGATCSGDGFVGSNYSRGIGVIPCPDLHRPYGVGEKNGDGHGQRVVDMEARGAPPTIWVFVISRQFRRPALWECWRIPSDSSRRTGEPGLCELALSGPVPQASTTAGVAALEIIGRHADPVPTLTLR